MAPALADVTICNEERFIPIRLPMEQLTRCSIEAPWETHRGILKLASNVVEARIFIEFDDETWPDHGDTIPLPNLQRLFVSHSEILAYLSFPVLEELAIQIYEEDQSEQLDHLQSSLIHSSCPLRRLCFSDWCPDAYDIFDILIKFPVIVELGIIVKDDNAGEAVDNLMETLVVSHSRAVAPQLTCLSFAFGDIGDHSYPDYELYLKMLKSRWHSERCALTSTPLDSDSDRGPAEAALHGLNVLQEEGLDLVLLNGPDAMEVAEEWLFCSQWNRIPVS
ncbi:hypothetical protein MVEN_01575900 [Mycena venus]|uniref:Uncharacterized protein n=1 Tax=Mycena venus TaxID=2733690 RepID=A0A8H6XR22_9AGAR|nr:hypothetical protein MVEN_01575900 [Mycena venus]